MLLLLLLMMIMITENLKLSFSIKFNVFVWTKNKQTSKNKPTSKLLILFEFDYGMFIYQIERFSVYKQESHHYYHHHQTANRKINFKIQKEKTLNFLIIDGHQKKKTLDREKDMQSDVALIWFWFWFWKSRFQRNIKHKQTHILCV